MENSKSEYNIDTLISLIELTEKYKNNRKRPRRDLGYVKFNKDMNRLVYALPSLKKLQNLIGMDELKNNIIDQILFYIQDLNSNEMMHTCLSGPPGIGKTTLGKILAELYCSLGFLSTSKFRVVGRTELIAGYLGQTALKTYKVLSDSKGGVLFLDEAYSLGYSVDDSGNSYAKECIDTINKFLSENTTDFIMIIAGYKEDLDKYFFSANKGLVRRFPWTYELKDYSVENITKIFKYQVEENDWIIDNTLTDQSITEILRKSGYEFKNNGGDTLLLFEKAKICHSRRVFGLPEIHKKIITADDITSAIKILKNNKVHHKEDRFKTPPPMMYI